MINSNNYNKKKGSSHNPSNTYPYPGQIPRGERVTLLLAAALCLRPKKNLFSAGNPALGTQVFYNYLPTQNKS